MRNPIVCLRHNLTVVCCSIVFITGCHTPDDYDKIFNNPLLYSNTVHELNTVVMGNNFGPIIASRNYLYAAIAGYEVIAAGHPKEYASLGGQLHGLGTVPAPAAGEKINYGLAALLAYCKLGEAVTFPEGSMRTYTDSLKKMAKEHGMPADMYSNSLAYADTVAAAIMRWSKKDRYLETRGAPEYTVKDSPGRWVPTPPAYASAMEPHWSTIRYVVMDSIDQFIPPPPLPFNVTDKNSPYYKEVKLIQNKVDSLTQEESFIAEFWDDNPFKLNVSGHLMFGTKKFSPGGHWMSITGIAAEKAKADLPTTATAYAKTAIALFDAFIQCWNVKYIYNTARPETVIDKYFDPNWRPHLQTPPFPEYTCGHCTISAAASEALTSVFGDNFSYTDTTELEFGINKRSFSSFREAALETMDSRFFGGIHFRYSTVVSNRMGKQIGELVATRLKMKK
ncbi:vanadium-dependent haloperoxidase [Flavitalea sp. BT771]|uniref:vanadium-dependent haloperoxidase n=1 Tax=Flavitalea sp. BT771 TaxID=3063329 RepID=UPI0026E428F9|nr:vanadium-dependent haloperoxidase [Flavitalea sp. BT771]MDO6431084.1 vanadium-dependent haloperoxidase [Flavitalea sp. BT771]MDV6219991.1 vanadium-dependent haloperoxidase [Flavitalea sp. BT771]